MSTAKLLERRTHQVPGKLSVSELFFEVPKDYSKPDHGSLRLFARSVERFERPVDPTKQEKKQLPWFLYLQGGPGMPCRPPQNVPWTNFVLDKGYQILFLDQRGTGMSSTITAQTLDSQGGPQKQAEYLKHFRADNIVRDCEAIRKTLTSNYPEKKQTWSILGQSFGGFCCVNYLSRFPEGLREVFTCGGLPPLGKQPDEIYMKTFKKCHERNRSYYKKYPEDVQRVKHIAQYLGEEHVELPSGGRLSLLRLRQLGVLFGAHTGIDLVHDMIFRFASDLAQFGFLTRPALSAFEWTVPFDNMILYALIHEALYMQGAASDWSADRVMRQFPEFMSEDTTGSQPILFTGEMVFRDMFTDYPELASLLSVADILAQESSWPDLYDEAQLAKNEVPVYSSTYVDDMYVDFEYARETAGKIKGCKEYITNIWYHNAISSKSDELMKELFALRDDVID